MRIALAILVTFSLGVAASCSDAGFIGSTKSDKDDKDAKTSGTGSGDELDPALPPSDVTGSYLTFSCGPANDAPSDIASPEKEEIIGCGFTSEKKVKSTRDIVISRVDLKLADAKSVTPTLTAATTSTIWHVFFALPKGLFATANDVQFAATIDGASIDTATVTTDKLEVNGILVKKKKPGAPASEEEPNDGNPSPSPPAPAPAPAPSPSGGDRVLNLPALFISENVLSYTPGGATFVATLDAECQSNATKYNLGAGWKALVPRDGLAGTAKEQLPQDKEVYSVAKPQVVLAGTSNLYSDKFLADAITTPDGQLLAFDQLFISGSAYDGGISDNCSNWTSTIGTEDSIRFGRVGPTVVQGFPISWLAMGVHPCDDVPGLRVVCYKK